MRVPLILAIAAVGVLASVVGCGSDGTLPPAPSPTFSDDADERDALVVDDDGADCPQADFHSIQAAVTAAQPGDRILVCRGVYLESVLVDKAELRIEAQGEPGDVVLRAVTQAGVVPAYGFHLQNTTGVLVQGFRVEGYGDANIIIDRGSGNTLRKNVVTAGAVDGIELLDTDANLLEHNVSFANVGPRSDGIFVWKDSDDNIIRFNDVFDNKQNGINVNSAGSGNSIVGNRTYGNVQRGIQNLNSDGNGYEGNRSFANGMGILIAVNSDHVIVRHNWVADNLTMGINVAGGGPGVSGLSTHNRIEKNLVTGNKANGIQLNVNADANVILLNVVRSSGIDGIRVNDAASDGNTIDGNILRENVEHDAHDNTAGSGTAGTANTWENNRCQTENRSGLCK